MTLIEARDLLFEVDPPRSVCVGANCWKHGNAGVPVSSTEYLVSIHEKNYCGVEWQQTGSNLETLVSHALAWLRDPRGVNETPQVGKEKK